MYVYVSNDSEVQGESRERHGLEPINIGCSLSAPFQADGKTIDYILFL